ncbi:MAG: helix-turn-helix domain-containing protein [Phascolarctobacterium sp.]
MTDTELYLIIGRNIKFFRNNAGYTQQEFADMIGISLSYLSKIEANKCSKSMSLSVINRMANVLKIDIQKLFENVPMC